MSAWWDYWPGYAIPVHDPELSSIAARLDRLELKINGLANQGAFIMATTQDLLDAVNGLAAAFAPLPAAIDALEAAVGAVQGISVADQANIDEALTAVKNLTAGVVAAVGDATDGVNEAAQP